MSPNPLLALFACALVSGSLAEKMQPGPPLGTSAAVYALLERLYPGASPSFSLSLSPTCPTAAACYTISDGIAGVIAISGTCASELSAGLGAYLRDYVNATVGWERGGGRRLPRPAAWPRVGAVRVASRVAPFSFAMNVCTHSYTLVWHSWAQWEAFIDETALAGINLVYALTGQEEVQWKVFSALGLNDTNIRGWFNGPAFLTWSRGQNSHGSSIAGPLPRSWMRAQWDLQRTILARERELGIMPILPAFQGNVPWPLAAALKDNNVTRAPAFTGPVDTGWMDSLDPVFGRVADLWMATLCADFGCPIGSWYQMDGFFHNGTSWGAALPALPSCIFSSPHTNSYLAGCTTPTGTPCSERATLADAQAACGTDVRCGGITLQGSTYQLRAGSKLIMHPGESSWLLTNGAACRPPPGPDPAWAARGAALTQGLQTCSSLELARLGSGRNGLKIHQVAD